TLQDQAVILRTAMCTLTAKQTLIPVAAQFDIADANQRLCTHRGLLLVTVSISPSAPRASGWSPALSLSRSGTVPADRAGSRGSGRTHDCRSRATSLSIVRVRAGRVISHRKLKFRGTWQVPLVRVPQMW